MPDKNAVTEMFDNISPFYDRLNHMLSFQIDRWWRHRTARHIARQHPRHLLDLATGTGDLAILLAKKIPNANIIALDRSQNMLHIAKEKANRKKHCLSISFVAGDAELLPFDDNTFDAVSIAFGVRNYQNQEQGLGEALRVLKPGGHIAILEFSIPEHPLIRPFYGLYFKHLLPAIGRFVSKNRNAYSYLPQSVYTFPKPYTFINIMRHIGFEKVMRQRLSFGIASLFEGTKPHCRKD